MIVKEVTENNKKVVIYHDDDPINPRSFDTLGKMVCFHGRYDLGDEHDYNHKDYRGWNEMKDDIVKKEDVVCILPVYLYDHSGISVSTKPFGCTWDSGQIGWIYATKKNVKERYAVKKVTKKIEERVEISLMHELKQYDCYLTGDMFRYEVYDVTKCDNGYHEDFHFVESASGFYDLDECLNDAYQYI